MVIFPMFKQNKAIISDHFLLLTGSQNKYGQEIKFRAAVEQHISESFKREGTFSVHPP